MAEWKALAFNGQTREEVLTNMVEHLIGEVDDWLDNGSQGCYTKTVEEINSYSNGYVYYPTVTVYKPITNPNQDKGSSFTIGYSKTGSNEFDSILFRGLNNNSGSCRINFSSDTTYPAKATIWMIKTHNYLIFNARNYNADCRATLMRMGSGVVEIYFHSVDNNKLTTKLMTEPVNVVQTTTGNVYGNKGKLPMDNILLGQYFINGNPITTTYPINYAKHEPITLYEQFNIADIGTVMSVPGHVVKVE